MKKVVYLLDQDEFGIHQKVIDWIGRNKTILEVGCASGYISLILSNKGCLVTGIEIDSDAAKKAEKHCHKVIIGDVEDKTTIKKLGRKRFDLITLVDVLEHLKDPENVLMSLGEFLKKEGTVIISVPNIGFLTNRLLHLLGRFEYTDWGIMDRSHLRFFTKRSILGLIENSGFILKKFDYVANFTQLPFYMQSLYPILGKRRWWRRLEYKITGLWPDGLAVQFLLLCQKR